MATTKAATVAGHFIKSYVDRIEKMEEERKAIGGDIRDIYAEAKGNGYDVKTIRWLVQERKVDAADRDERDALRDTYAMAIGMAVNLVQVEGLSLREAARRTGTSKSSIHRALAVPEVSHDPDGVITETGESCGPCPVSPAEGAGKGNGLPSAKGNADDSPAARRHTSDDALAPALGTSQCADGAAPGPHDTSFAMSLMGTLQTADEAPATPSVGAVASESERVAPHIDDDSALAAMEEAGQRLRQMSAERGL